MFSRNGFIVYEDSSNFLYFFYISWRSFEDFQLLDDEKIENPVIKRDLIEICEQGANRNHSDHGIDTLSLKLTTVTR